MKWIKNDKGITLVELIAALALVTLAAVLIMTTLSIGIQHSIVEGEKTRIQQEANTIVAKLLNIHREGKCYQLQLTPENDLVVLTYQNSGEGACGDVFTTSFPINNQNYAISTTNPPLGFEKVNPTIENNAIRIVLSSESRDTITYEISTTLSRYKTN